MAYLPPLNGGRANVTIGGNTAGAGAIVSSGTVTWAGGNNITLSQAGNAITISGAPNVQGSDAFGMSNLGNTSGNTGMVSGSQFQFALAGGNNITLNQNLNASSGTITISAANQTMQTQNLHNLTLGGNTAGVMAQVSSGTLTLAGGNNITLNQAGNAITIAGPAAGGGAAISAAGSSISNGTAVFANSNGVGFGMNGSTITASHNAITSQTVQTQNMVSVNGSTGNISFSNANGVTFGGNNSTLTASVSFNQTAQTQSNIAGFYDGASSISTGTVFLSDANNVSFGITGQSITGSASFNQTAQTQSNIQALSAGTTSANTGAISFANSNGVSFGLNGNTMTASAAAGGGGGIALSGGGTSYSNGTVNLSAAGGALTISGSTNSVLSFSVPQTSSLAGTGGVSIATNGGTISIGAPLPTDVGMMGTAAGGSTQGASGSNNNGLFLYAGSNITMSQSTNAGGASITFQGPDGGGAANPILSFYQNLVPQNSAQPYTTLGVAYNTMLVQPLSPIEGYGFPGDITVSTFMMQLSATGTASSVISASSFASTVKVGLYLLSNSSQLTLVNSASTSWSGAANSANSTIWAGARYLTIHSSLWSAQPVLSFGARYWYGVLHSSAGLSSGSVAPSWLGQYAAASTQRSGTIGVSQANNSSQGMIPFLGIYSASLNSIPPSLGNSQINKTNVSAGFVPSIVLNATFSAF